MRMGIPNGPKVVPQMPSAAVDLKSGLMTGRVMSEFRRTLKDLKGFVVDETALAQMPGERLAYRVQMWAPVDESTEGGLIWGVTIIEPGDVGGEFFMTKGHYHARREAAEFYWTYEGKGLLLMMDENRQCRVEEMAPGSLHYIPGGMAHRTVNVGDVALSFGSCWPATAGHDYGTIAREGFSVRVFRDGGGVRVVSVG